MKLILCVKLRISINVIIYVLIIRGIKMTDLDIQSWPEIPTIAHFCSLFR